MLSLGGCYQSIVTGEDAGVAADLPAATTIAGLSAGDSHSCLLLTTGRVVCWGHRLDARAWPADVVGDALFDGSCVARRGGGSVCGAALGPVAFALEALTLLGAGGTGPRSVVAGGGRGLSSAGDGFFVAATGAVAVAAGRAHQCLLDAAGQVRCRGENLAGQCGQPPSAFVERFTEVPGLGAVEAIAAGGEHTCALAAGRVRCWGRRAEGELGDGRLDLPATCGIGASLFACTHAPREVTGIRDAEEVAAGQFHTCVRRAGGEVSCFGSDAFNRLGLAGEAPDLCGEAPCSGRPLPVDRVTNARHLSAGRFHTCAASAREVRCWGSGAGAVLGEYFLEVGELEARLDL